MVFTSSPYILIEGYDSEQHGILCHFREIAGGKANSWGSEDKNDQHGKVFYFAIFLK